MKNFMSTKLGQFCIATGWIGILSLAGYMVVSGQLTLSGIEQLVKDFAPILTGIAAGGGVHFIWNKTSKNGNGANSNGSPPVH